MPFEQLIMDNVMANLNASAEKYTWQGDTNLGVQDLKQVDEWLKKDGHFSSIRWYTERQWNESKQWQPTPM